MTNCSSILLKSWVLCLSGYDLRERWIRGIAEKVQQDFDLQCNSSKRLVGVFSEIDRREGSGDACLESLCMPTFVTKKENNVLAAALAMSTCIRFF